MKLKELTDEELFNKTRNSALTGVDFDQALLREVKRRKKLNPDVFKPFLPEPPKMSTKPVSFRFTRREYNQVLGMIYSEIQDIGKFTRDYPENPSNQSVLERQESLKNLYNKMSDKIRGTDATT